MSLFEEIDLDAMLAPVPVKRKPGEFKLIMPDDAELMSFEISKLFILSLLLSRLFKKL